VPAGSYLLSHSVGCLPVMARPSASDGFFQSWQSLGGNAWPSWLTYIDTFCQALATLFNAKAEQFCPQSNVSSALTKIIYSLPHTPHKNTILLSENDFPSLGFVLSLAQQRGWQLRFLAKDTPIYDLETWRKQLTPDVKLVFITHVNSVQSQRAPVKALIALAKQHDIISIVDIAQSAGVIPIDLTQWAADFVVGSCVKWLCGGPGAGFLWVNPAILMQCRPLDVGWFSHDDPFEFDIHHFKYATDAKRFWGGTPSVLPYLIAASSITLIHQIKVAKIYDHNQALLDILHQGAMEHGIEALSPRSKKHRGGTLTLKLNHPTQTVSLFNQHQILFDVRQQNGFRFSPHIYNTTEEIQALGQLFKVIGKK